MAVFKRLIALLAALLTTTAGAQTFEKCVPGKQRSATETCVVDGDTFWLNGQKMRLAGIDTPEGQSYICGGDFERQLAAKASARLLQLLNSGDLDIALQGKDRFERWLVTVAVHGKDVGQILVRERLARRWPDGPEWWCY